MLKMVSLISLLLSGVMLFSGCAMTVLAPGPEEPISSNHVIEEPIELPEVNGGFEVKNVGFNSFDSGKGIAIADPKKLERHLRHNA